MPSSPVVPVHVKAGGDGLQLVLTEMYAQLGEHLPELLCRHQPRLVGVHGVELPPQVLPHVVNLQEDTYNVFLNDEP